MTEKSAHPEAVNAIDLLVEDHKKVKKLFKEFDKLKDKPNAEKSALVDRILR